MGRRRNSGCGPRRRPSSGGGSGQVGGNGGTNFNPFPTVRKARLRVTKYGLYN